MTQIHRPPNQMQDARCKIPRPDRQRPQRHGVTEKEGEALAPAAFGRLTAASGLGPSKSELSSQLPPKAMLKPKEPPKSGVGLPR